MCDPKGTEEGERIHFYCVTNKDVYLSPYITAHFYLENEKERKNKSSDNKMKDCASINVSLQP
jgi:hypothetical protein